MLLRSFLCIPVGLIAFSSSAVLADGIADLRETYSKVSTRAADSLTADLETLAAAAETRGQLDDLKGLNESLERWKLEHVVPTGPTDSARKAGVTYSNRVARARSALLLGMEKLVKEFTRAGQLEKANSLQIELDEMTQPVGFESVAGSWSMTYGTTGRSFIYKIDETGGFYTNKKKNGSIENIDGRFLFMNAEASQRLEFVRRGEQLIVLGWTTRKGRNPFHPDSNSVSCQPDHVGIATKF